MAGHLQQSKARNPTYLNPGTINLQRVAYAGFYRALVASRQHIDEIDYDEAAHVTQPQLPGNLVCRFEVGAQRGVFNIGAAGCLGGVDVD